MGKKKIIFVKPSLSYTIILILTKYYAFLVCSQTKYFILKCNINAQKDNTHFMYLQQFSVLYFILIYKFEFLFSAGIYVCILVKKKILYKMVLSINV